MRLVLVVLVFICAQTSAQSRLEVLQDTVATERFERGLRNVNKCTPLDHLTCVYITGTEVYHDGREGKSSRHWWRMSYIGRACTQQYGTVFGQLFEGFFAIPHYIGVGIGNGVGYVVYLLRGSPAKIAARKQKREERRRKRKVRRETQ